MNNVEEQILSYPYLSVEKQREVDAYVEDHPEWAPLLRDVRALESLGRTPREDDASVDPFLRTYVVVQHFHPEDISPRLREIFARLEARLDEDPALRERANAIRDRLEDTEAALDPVAHFEELTGHALTPDAETDETAPAARSTTPDPARDRGAASSPRSVIDQLLALPLALRMGGAAIALLLGTYAVLFTASEASQSTLDRLATVRVSPQMVESYSSINTRSALPSADTTQGKDLYLNALSALRSARTSTFGLFPKYDDEKIAKAEQLLTQLIEQEASASFLALEARFYLGKVYLAQEQVEPARKQFEIVIREGGRKNADAERILETLRTEYPLDEGDTPTP